MKRLAADDKKGGEQRFTDWTPSRINDYIRSNEGALQTLSLSAHNWVIIDQECLETFMCIVVDQEYDEEAGTMSNNFKAARIPCTEAWAMYANLDIANMGFEDFVDEETGILEDGVYMWKPMTGSNDALQKTYQEAEAKREAALAQAREAGLV